MYVNQTVYNPATMDYESPAWKESVENFNAAKEEQKRLVEEQEMSKMDENACWTFVRGWEDRYMVSDDGQVWSIHLERNLMPVNNDGYKYVTLSRDGVTYNVGVHRLVAENFLSETPLGELVVHHLDQDKTNNSVDNLAIMTASAHMKLHMTGKESGKKKPVRVYEGETGKFIKECDSLTAAAEFINGNVGEISRAIKCGYQARGYRFTFSDELECRNQKGEIVAEKNSEKEHKTIIKVYDENDMYVGEYYSLREVGEVIGKSGEAVRVAINKNRSCGGYTFEKIK